MYRQIENCRICGNRDLVQVLDLGEQALTGVFPKTRTQKMTAGPLRLVKCTGGERVCGLLQLGHSYESSEMYGVNYGYRSGLNESMVRHLDGKIKSILERFAPREGGLIIDIGSNDGTTLRAYPAQKYSLVGIDPTGIKFKQHYSEHIELIPDFFSAKLVRERFGSRKASIITCFSMFYDLEDPVDFMREIAETLDDEGVWVFEQSYMPTMLARNSYDTVCHEHLEYYALRQIKWMADAVGLVLLDVEFNDINGGSVSIVAGKRSAHRLQSKAVDALLAREDESGLGGLRPYREFAERVSQSREQLLAFLGRAAANGETVSGLGASTKGNVLLQYCGIREAQVQTIGEVNPEKYGCFTPGTLIPIVSEEEMLRNAPDYLLVLPWHFRPFFRDNRKLTGRRLVFPLPDLEFESV